MTFCHTFTILGPNTFVSNQCVETSTAESTTIIEDFSILREGTFFIGVGGGGWAGVFKNFFAKKVVALQLPGMV